MNGEKIVNDWLRATTAVTAITNPTAATGQDRIVSKTPGDTTRPWVKATLINARSVHADVHHLIEFTLQLDCYASYTGGQPQAYSLMDAVRAALQAMPGVRSGVTVTRAAATWFRLVDPDLKGNDDNPRERYILTSSVFMHA